MSKKDERIAQLERRIAQLEGRIAELQALPVPPVVIRPYRPQPADGTTWDPYRRWPMPINICRSLPEDVAVLKNVAA